MTMLAVFALPMLLLSQMVLARSNYRELVDLADLLTVEKRFIEETRPGYDRVCNQDPVELGLVIDSSASIRREDFAAGQKFLSDFLSNYDIGPGKKQVRVAAVTFGRGVYLNDSFNLNTYKTKEEVLDKVVHMKHQYGTYTDTGDALEYMREQQMSNTRPGVPRIVIVLTDGNSQKRYRTRDQAKMTTEANITVWAVGVGSTVRQEELINIAGGDPSKVIRADSYEDLQDIMEVLSYTTCVWKLKPTTTTPMPTTTPPIQIQACSELFPSDINFIFSPATLGLDATSWVTQFISHTIKDEKLESGFQYGVVSGDCPADAGFRLDEYTDSVEDIKQRLSGYDRDKLPALVESAAQFSFTEQNGARDYASRIAVIFLGPGKMHMPELNEQIEKMFPDVQVYVVKTDPGVDVSGLTNGARVLDYGSSRFQAEEFVTRICHLEEMF